jgi:hypothetical protein
MVLTKLSNLGPLSLIIIIGLIFLPVAAPILTEAEADYLPVVSKAKISSVAPDLAGGVYFYINFEKTRQCEFLGISWYDKNGVRLVLDLEPSAKNTPITRPTGEWNIGPWRLFGVETLEGTRAYVHHKCHPLWTTISRLY